MVTKSRREPQAVFRAIADPTRRRILHLLRPGEQSVGDIAANFRTSRPAISRHLRLLRSAGLVAMRRSGTTRFCRLNARPLQAVHQWLKEYEAFWDQSLNQLKQFVEENP